MLWIGEPKLEEVLSDPIVRAVMACDGVDQGALRLLLEDAARLLALPTSDAVDESAPNKASAPMVRLAHP
jgi:hypothetical protein